MSSWARPTWPAGEEITSREAARRDSSQPPWAKDSAEDGGVKAVVVVWRDCWRGAKGEARGAEDGVVEARRAWGV